MTVRTDSTLVITVTKKKQTTKQTNKQNKTHTHTRTERKDDDSLHMTLVWKIMKMTEIIIWQILNASLSAHTHTHAQ
jgi:hypothetical protein